MIHAHSTNQNYHFGLESKKKKSRL